jgi:hypothetical protein
MITDPRLALRPEVPTLPADNPPEVFQNQTLRPVLKLQHDQLLTIFLHFATKRKFQPEQVAKPQRHEKIKELLARDNRLRGLLFGAVIGQFTLDELTEYCEHESEYNRRMTSMLTKRLLSAL